MTIIKPLLPAVTFEEIHGVCFSEMRAFLAVFYGTACSVSWHLWKGVF
jgi:hypothetical protein